MSNPVNQAVYYAYAPIYDLLFSGLVKHARQRAVDLLCLQKGEHLFIPGIGTGLDILFIPTGVQVTGIDINQAMLSKAQEKEREGVNLMFMDAQALLLPDSFFDAVLLSLILSVAPDGRLVLEEAWRVLRPGGRMVIFDKFLPEYSEPSTFRRLLGWLIRWLGTDPNRRFGEMMKQIPGATVSIDKPVLMRGQYRVILLKKPDVTDCV